ncbi:MAG: ATP-binding protein [Deltaproteobacteria bacterium]|jgi:DNA replication protein DnaC|nr:ATP-binding protein [Deltaproteobacteria bacterium]MBT7711233.1 ATP-binding protein [Deltaproteobacteria bacterium]
MNDELIYKLKYSRLSGLLENWDKIVEMAEQNDFTPHRLLEHVVETEYEIKMENSRRWRLRRAKIPEPYRMETFPFDRQPALKKRKILSLYDSFDYITDCRNIIWIGPTGVGKTGLATAFLNQAIDKGYSGRFVTFSEIVEQLYQSVADHSEAKVVKTYSSYDCLLIDELGYIEVEPVQVGLFFTLMHKRHKKKTTMITTNLGFQQWNDFLKNDHLTAALIDRLTENSHVINMKKCTSLRPKLAAE